MTAQAQISSGPRPSDKWIPWYFVLFFLVIFLANGIFVYFALSSQPGVIEKGHYEIGLDYDDRIAAKKAQEALGWQTVISLDKGHMSFSLKGRAGQPLEGALVTARLVRTVEGGHDFDLPLTQSVPGHYEASVEFPLPGQWDAYIYVVWENQIYQTSQKFVVKP